MAKWLPRILLTIRELVAHGHARFTHKANEELKVLGLDQEDALEIIAGLGVKDFSARLASERTDEWMYVFKPPLGAAFVYVKLVLRGSCIIVSFHEEQGHEDESD